MSTWCDNVLSGLSGICRASSAIRACFVETFSRLDVPAITPSYGSVIRGYLPSAGSLGSLSQLRGYYAAIRLPLALAAVLCFSLWTVGTDACVLSFAPAVTDATTAGLGLVRVPSRFRSETRGSPRFLGSPVLACRVL
jgi:hypothetical protein